LSQIESIKLRRKTAARTASVVLFVHGFVEVLAVMLAFVPAEFLPTGFQERLVFWAVISATYGVSRLIAGYAIWFMKEWGAAFGIALSTTTIIVAPSMYPFGIMDLPLAIIVLVSPLSLRFSDEKL